MLVALNQSLNQIEIQNRYKKAKRRLLIFEYDGALVGFERHPDLTIPSRELKALMSDLARDPKNTVMLISGRDMDHLDKYWFDLPIILVAENGAYYRVPSGAWQSLFKATNDWMDRISNAINSLSFQFAGSFVERKNHSIVWHYRNVKEPIPPNESSQILAAIRALNQSQQFSIRHNEFAVELSTNGIDAGSFIARWIGGQAFDFILALGTSISETSVFPLLTDHAVTVRIGSTIDSHANFHVAQREDVLLFIRDLLPEQNTSGSFKQGNGSIFDSGPVTQS